MSGYGPIFEWSNYTTEELKKILRLWRQLEKLGIVQDEDMVCSACDELYERTGEPV